MGLFYEILSSINNPNQAGSVDRLSGVLNAVQQVTGSRGLDAQATQLLMSAMGGPVRSALQQNRGNAGDLLGQLAGANPSLSAMQALFPASVQQQMINAVAQKTGLPTTAIQAVLPVVIPAVCQLLNMGSHSSGRGTNNILNSFLDGDHDGDTDLGDIIKLAGRFITPSLYPNAIA